MKVHSGYIIGRKGRTRLPENVEWPFSDDLVCILLADWTSYEA